MTARDDLRSMLDGFRLSAAVAAAAELGLSDQLAAAPLSPADLAEAVGADPDTMYRLLRALATVGVYAESDEGMFTNTPLSEALRSGVPGSLRPLARTAVDPAIWSAWAHLADSVRTGKNAFTALHGHDVWTHRRQHPERNAVFNDNMAAQSALVAGAVANAYDFRERHSVVDVGGGQGALLEAVLTRYDHLSGIVFDQPHAVADAPSERAPASVAARWSARRGNFFDAVPAGDVHLLKSILHDWPDDVCVAILRTCRRSLDPGGVVLVVERLLGRAGYEVDTALLDLTMLLVPGGRERTEQEYSALFEAAGLRLTAVVHTTTAVSVLEAQAATGPENP